MDPNERQCLECGRILKGRPDKKFCTDACRNTYNNRQHSDVTNAVRNINNILRKNRRLLDEAIRPGEDMGKHLRMRLQEQGFDFRFHTHQYTNKKGQVYVFVYDLGYLPLDGDWLLIVRRKDPA